MTRKLQQLELEERVTLRGQGLSLSRIGRPLGRSAGSLSRERHRNREASAYAWKAAY